MRVKKNVFDLNIADVDVGGDVHRVILNGIKKPQGITAFDSRLKLSGECDELRKLLISYPYGHNDMCANFIFETGREEAGHAYVIMESMGYPYYSGSNTIAVVAALLEYGLVPIVEGQSDICVESPGGLVKVRYRIEDDLIQEVTVSDEGAYVIKDCATVEVPEFGEIDYALVWSGTYYAMVDAASVNIMLDYDHIPQMKHFGAKLIDAISHDFSYVHTQYGAIEAPGFVHFMGDQQKIAEKHYRGWGATYGHPATIYYCPTGTGTSARMALLVSRGEMEPTAVFDSISAMGNCFVGKGLSYRASESHNILRTDITARPFVLATTTIHIDFDNPLMRHFANLKEIIA